MFAPFPHRRGTRTSHDRASSDRSSTAADRYTHLPSLGGRRRGRRDSRNTQWRNASFRAYADYMETREFKEALEDLLASPALEPTAIMCAEAVPWRCHRSLISDAVVADRRAGVSHPRFGEPRSTNCLPSAESSRTVRYDVAPQNELFESGPIYEAQACWLPCCTACPSITRSRSSDGAKPGHFLWRNV